ncbi:MAG: sulfurtransferase [Rhodobacteraceae bacterium]|nr:sulfurtransferase [Paracoccaceae bacterium]MCB1367956.1 sulfurtransferase [Paracoccaceae bacterium]
MPFGFSNPFRQSNVMSMPAQEAVQKAANGEIILIDVRDHNELARTGKAVGALHIPLFLLNQRADPRHPECHPELKTDKPVALYCASGARSHMAAQTLSSFGFAEVYNIGGLLHWQSAGGVCEAA